MFADNRAVKGGKEPLCICGYSGWFKRYFNWFATNLIGLAGILALLIRLRNVAAKSRPVSFQTK
jgi:hypothetical protein